MERAIELNGKGKEVKREEMGSNRVRVLSFRDKVSKFIKSP